MVSFLRTIMIESMVKDGREMSPNVEKVLQMFEQIKQEGGIVERNTLKQNKELNIAISHGEYKLDLNVETHDIPKRLGGMGDDAPVRHMTVDLSKGKQKLKGTFPNTGHIILRN